MGYKIFQIDTSTRPTSDSYSRRCGQYFIRKFQEKFGQLEVSYLDLARDYPSEYFLSSMCSSNIWLWCLSADVSIVPDLLIEWINFIHRKNFVLAKSCNQGYAPKKSVIIANWQKEIDVLAPKFHVEPIIRHSLNLLGVDNVDFFHLFQKDNSPSGEIYMQKSINNYIASLHL